MIQSVIVYLPVLAVVETWSIKDIYVYLMKIFFFFFSSFLFFFTCKSMHHLLVTLISSEKTKEIIVFCFRGHYLGHLKDWSEDNLLNKSIEGMRRNKQFKPFAITFSLVNSNGDRSGNYNVTVLINNKIEEGNYG